jgi:hypothetical protein
MEGWNIWNIIFILEILIQEIKSRKNILGIPKKCSKPSNVPYQFFNLKT